MTILAYIQNAYGLYAACLFRLKKIRVYPSKRGDKDRCPILLIAIELTNDGLYASELMLSLMHILSIIAIDNLDIFDLFYYQID